MLRGSNPNAALDARSPALLECPATSLRGLSQRWPDEYAMGREHKRRRRGGSSRSIIMTQDVLQRLAATIQARRGESAGKSYTKQLLEAGAQRCAKKLGEEAIETVIAAVASDGRALT